MPESAQGHPEALHAVCTFGHEVHMLGGVFQVAEHVCEVIAFCRLIGDAPQVTRTHDGGQRQEISDVPFSEFIIHNLQGGGFSDQAAVVTGGSPDL